MSDTKTIKKVKYLTEEIQARIMFDFDFRQNTIVCNVTDQMGLVGFETDVLVLTKAGYAHGFEVKVSRSDLLADLKKVHFAKLKESNCSFSVFKRYYGRFKHFSYVVPVELRDIALEVIPSFCGLYVFQKVEHGSVLWKIREPKKIFDFSWSEKDQKYLARLGAMRAYKLMKKIVELKHKQINSKI